MSENNGKVLKAVNFKDLIEFGIIPNINKKNILPGTKNIQIKFQPMKIMKSGKSILNNWKKI